MIRCSERIYQLIGTLLLKYHAEYAILFGFHARGEESVDSDIDVVVVGGASFHSKDIFAFGEVLRELTQKMWMSLKFGR